MNRELLQKTFSTMLVLALLLSIAGLMVSAQGGTPEPLSTTGYFSVETEVLEDGTSIDVIVINGPPTPPPGYERKAVELPESNRAAGLVTLSVPAYNWSFGCSATSAAMIAAYYDRTSYPNMYTGPTNGGVMPMDNSSWPDWYDGYQWRHQCPLSATHNGLDGRTTRGHVDDYWVQYGHSGPDPYVTNGWPEHTLEDCTGDFMKTNRAASGNADGSTTFVNFPNGAPMYASDLEFYGFDDIDGGYGFKLFYESRGYAVDTMYNQYIYGYGGTTQGFTYTQYKAEIDAGRPVMIHVEGHTMVGVGYDDSSSNLMYINDTWDYATHTMIWGTNYLGMPHFGVTIVRLEAPLIPASPTGLAANAVSQSQINLSWTDNSANESGFKIERSPNSPGSWTQIDTVGPNVTSYPDTGLSSNTTYYYRVRAWNAAGDSGYSNVAHDTTFGGLRYWSYLPVVTWQAGGAAGWTTILTEDFEGVLPGPWTIHDGDGAANGEYFWAKRGCRKNAGSFAGWAVGGGADGDLLSCGDSYPNNANSWMRYGPFSLADASAAELTLKLWLNSELFYDYFFWGASTDGSSFSGWRTWGNLMTWTDRVLDLADVPLLGDLTGQPHVWIALVFRSDSTGTFPEGAYVDDILLRKYVGTAARSLERSAAPDPAALQVVPATLMLEP